MTKLTQELIQSRFDYYNGNLYYKIRPANCVHIGDKAGYLNNNKYYMIRINYKSHYAHRLIFLYHYGYLPKIIDHIDGNSLNNKIENLREVTLSQNGMNQKSQQNTSSQYKGVYFNKQNQKWIAQIRINDELKYLGSFKLEIKAALAYNTKATKLFGKYAKLNEIGDKIND